MKDQHFVPCGFPESLMWLLIWSPDAQLFYQVSILRHQLSDHGAVLNGEKCKLGKMRYCRLFTRQKREVPEQVD